MEPLSMGDCVRIRENGLIGEVVDVSPSPDGVRTLYTVEVSGEGVTDPAGYAVGDYVLYEHYEDELDKI